MSILLGNASNARKYQPCWMTMSMLHVHVNAVSMPMLHVHIDSACSCPHVHVLAASTCGCPGCMSLSMLHVRVYAAWQCPCCVSISMLQIHVNVHSACLCPSCISMFIPMTMFMLRIYMYCISICTYTVYLYSCVCIRACTGWGGESWTKTVFFTL